MGIRVAAVQARNRTFSYTVPTVAEALDKVGENLDALISLAEAAATQGCDIIAFPEDCLGTLEWEAGHWEEVAQLLVPAEKEMLDRLGAVAARTGMAIICCNDTAAAGKVFNTAILIGAAGREIGRYHKVQPTWSERARAQGSAFPVYEIPGIGGVGMCICYDMVFPETTRALALGGADIVFHSTMGGASLASGDASLAAFRARAVDNFLYLVVAFRGGGSMIINPQGEVIATGKGADDLVVADIDPAGGRAAGDALGGITEDFRARLFRERNPAAYGILTAEKPPALEKLSGVEMPSVEQAARLFHEGLTTGADAFYEADAWMKEGKIEEARARFSELAAHFGSVWIGRVAKERLEQLAE